MKILDSKSVEAESKMRIDEYIPQYLPINGRKVKYTGESQNVPTAPTDTSKPNANPTDNLDRVRGELY